MHNIEICIFPISTHKYEKYAQSEIILGVHFGFSQGQRAIEEEKAILEESFNNPDQ